MNRREKREAMRLLRPLLREFTREIANERAQGKSEDYIELMLLHIDQKQNWSSPEFREFAMGMLREAARLPMKGPDTVQ